MRETVFIPWETKWEYASQCLCVLWGGMKMVFGNIKYSLGYEKNTRKYRISSN